jgi:cysteine desulfurase
VAAFLGCQVAELVFTSGATEANHMAVLGALGAARGTARRRLVLSAVEHPGLLALGRRLAGEGVPVDLIPVDAQGRLDLEAAKELIRDDVALVSVMGANNETGVLMPIAELAELAHARGALLHVDATQLAGVGTELRASGADRGGLGAQDFGPKGVGALVVKKGLALPALFSGRQERQRRGGTENLPGLIGFAAAGARPPRSPETCPHAVPARAPSKAAARAAGNHVDGRPRTTPCLRFGADAEQVLNKPDAPVCRLVRRGLQRQRHRAIARAAGDGRERRAGQGALRSSARTTPPTRSAA